MYSYFAAVLSRIYGPSFPIIPPEDIGLFNFAPIPEDKKFDFWLDKDSPFPETQIPKGSKWTYTIHIVEETGLLDVPLRAGKLVGGPLTSIEEANEIARKVEGMGFFTCIFAGVIKNKELSN